MTKNNNLHRARRERNDEFYTLYQDIEREMKHYSNAFGGKIVYCNCDDARHSNFTKYFVDNFDSLGLKKLICTCYNANGNGMVFFYDGHTSHLETLQGNGDFRSEECISYLKECDVVVTNPPFSLFRYYVKQLMEYGKRFIVLGNMNAIAYKEIFPYVKANQLWWGASIHSGDRKFYVPDNYPLNASTCGVDENGKKYLRVTGIRWFTNIDHNKTKPSLTLTKKYNPIVYPKYDNYDAINVNKVVDIPIGYQGIMGVPITFLDKYNSNEYELIDVFMNPIVDGKQIYKRLLVKHKPFVI